MYGHRNDAAGYAANLERFDARLAALLPRLGAGDLLVITADHGNDPTTPSTDHSREHVPVLAYGPGVRPGADLGVRATFADLGQTLAPICSASVRCAHGTSFLRARCLTRMTITASSSSSASARSSRRRRPRAPTRAGGCGPSPRIRSARRSSAIAIA